MDVLKDIYMLSASSGGGTRDEALSVCVGDYQPGGPYCEKKNCACGLGYCGRPQISDGTQDRKH